VTARSKEGPTRGARSRQRGRHQPRSGCRRP
jgi:hypothetical protein